jgi:hypothetical protein
MTIYTNAEQQAKSIPTKLRFLRWNPSVFACCLTLMLLLLADAAAPLNLGDKPCGALLHLPSSMLQSVTG